jgi:hypothetical protein
MQNDDLGPLGAYNSINKQYFSLLLYPTPAMEKRLFFGGSEVLRTLILKSLKRYNLQKLSIALLKWCHEHYP